MTYPLLSRFRDHIAQLPPLMDSHAPDPALLLWQQQRGLSCYYAPFDHVNTDAKIIIVGITPGHTQMNRSLMAVQKALTTGLDDTSALSQVKQQASLSGNMRPRIVEMLNHLGYASQLGIECCSQLWGEHHDLVHFCSILKYPIFFHGKDYCGQVDVFAVEELTQLLMTEFVNDLSRLSPTIPIVPLGEMVAKVLITLSQQTHIQQPLPMLNGQVIAPPHPSGANAESIALLMMNDYPALETYQQQMYQQYLDKQAWLKKPNGQPQDKEKYYKARAARWAAVSRVRKAYNL